MIALADSEVAGKIEQWKKGLGEKIEKANRDLAAISEYEYKC